MFKIHVCCGQMFSRLLLFFSSGLFLVGFTTQALGLSSLPQNPAPHYLDHQGAEVLNLLQDQFNEDLGRVPGDSDYVYITGNNKLFSNIPPGARSIRVKFNSSTNGHGLVGGTNPKTSEVNIFFYEAANICSIPLSVPMARRIKLYSLILWHEAQHIPTDGGEDSLPGYVGPGVGPYEPDVANDYGVISCSHLQLYIKSYEHNCEAMEAFLLEAGVVLTEEECEIMEILCAFNEQLLDTLNEGVLSSPLYHLVCGQLSPWISDPCDPCSGINVMCTPSGSGITVIGPLEPTDFNYASSFSPLAE